MSYTRPPGNAVIGRFGGAYTRPPGNAVIGSFAPATPGEVEPVDLTITGSFAPLAVSVSFVPSAKVQITGSFAPLTVTMALQYRSNTARPTVLQTSSLFSTLDKVQQGAAAEHQEASALPAGTSSSHQYGVHVAASVAARTPGNLQPGRSAWFVRHQRAMAEHDGAALAHQEASHALRPDLASAFEAATGLRQSTRFGHQDGTRTHSHARVRHENARALVARVSSAHQPGTPLIKGWHAEHEAAMQPIPGITLPPAKPTDPPPFSCYTPNGELVFGVPWVGGGELVFMCGDGTVPPPPPGSGGPIIIPVRRVYLVSNSLTLTRLSDGTPIPTEDFSMSLDFQTFVWSFNAVIHPDTLPLIRTGATFAELMATINGVGYHFLIDDVERERGFEDSALRIGGRSRLAALSSPNSPSMVFFNDGLRTARQLMDDVLTFNGVPLGWAVDWTLEDWTVPAGVFNHQGSYISALAAIAGAAGGYLQPVPSAKGLRVLHKYPVKAWAWSTATPDFELPADVTVRIGEKWRSAPNYNRIFVSGMAAGIRGEVTRAGTGGDIEAQMVVDQLITAEPAARQRGVAELSAGGDKMDLTLRLPVLNDTGIIVPGKFVRFLDGGEANIGLVRSTNIDYKFPAMYQTIEVETYAG